MASILTAFGVGQKSAGTDRKEQLNSFGDLSSLAANGEAAGEGATGDALARYSKLLSGNNATVDSAVAPVTNAASSQINAQSRQLASDGTSRGGGVNAAEQTTADKIPEATQTAVNNSLGGATSSLGSLGTTLTSQAGNDASSLGGQAQTAKVADQERGEKLTSDVVGDLSPISAAVGGGSELTDLLTSLG